jgi:hypothetical protein
MHSYIIFGRWSQKENGRFEDWHDTDTLVVRNAADVSAACRAAEKHWLETTYKGDDYEVSCNPERAVKVQVIDA